MAKEKKEKTKNSPRINDAETKRIKEAIKRIGLAKKEMERKQPIMELLKGIQEVGEVTYSLGQVQKDLDFCDLKLRNSLRGE